MYYIQLNLKLCSARCYAVNVEGEATLLADRLIHQAILEQKVKYYRSYTTLSILHHWSVKQMFVESIME